MKAGIAAILLLAMVAAASCTWDRVTTAGFWFEDVTFDASEVEADRLGGAITAQEMARVRAVALAELQAAYAGFRIRIGESPDARFRIRVVQTLRSVTFPRAIGPAGESRGIWPIGGQGAVNFRLLASYAIARAPAGSDRAAIIDAIGRGIGRTAAHELAHQILGSKDIHQSRDVRSYEYANADRAEQYYGPVRWDLARPLLEKRLGRAQSSPAAKSL